MAIYNGDISVSANFQLNINKPLDARTVVDNVSDLSSISFKYQGMLVYIKNDDKYYSYNGTIWNELSTGGTTLTAENGLNIVDDTIKLGGELIEETTIRTENSLNILGQNDAGFLYLGKQNNNDKLAYIEQDSTVFVSNQIADFAEYKGNQIVANPGGFVSRNFLQYTSYSHIQNTPETALIKFADSKIIRFNLYNPDGIQPGSGESFIINGVTFTEGVDFTGQGNNFIDAENLRDNIDWTSLNIVATIEIEDYPNLVLTSQTVITATNNLSNVSLIKNEHNRIVVADDEGVLLQSGVNKVNITDDNININKDINIIIKDETDIIKTTQYSNKFGIFNTNRDDTDSSISSTNVFSTGSQIANSNNKKIIFVVTAEIYIGESITINDVTFTEGDDFFTSNDGTLDAITLSNLDYSSVPNFINVELDGNTLTYNFTTIDNTITSNISNGYIGNYIYTTSVFAGQSFAIMQSNNSGLLIDGRDGHTFSDNTNSKQGLKYNIDYSATFTDRSLVDKAYVDSRVVVLTGENGITLNTDIIELGGTLNRATDIDLNDNPFTISDTGNLLFDPYNTIINDYYNTTSIDWGNRILYNSSGVELLNWNYDNLQTSIAPSDGTDITNKNYVDTRITYFYNDVNTTITNLSDYVYEYIDRFCPDSSVGNQNGVSTTYVMNPSMSFTADINTANADIKAQVSTINNKTGQCIFMRCGIPGSATSTYKLNVIGGYITTLNQDEWVLIRYNGYIWETIATNKYLVNPGGGTDGQVLATNGSGVLSWVDKDANINAYKTIFVDAVNGNDATAVNYNISKRYATIKTALANATSNDTVYVFPGLYDEYNIPPVHNVTLYLSENAIIQPTTNSGNVPVITDLAIPNWSSVLYTMEMNFKIRGKGKIINKGATAQYNNAALMLVLAKSRWDVELDTLSSYQIYGGSTLIIKNTKITLSGCAFRHSIVVRPNVTHIDCEFQNAHIGLIPIGTLGGRYMSFKRCRFVRTVALSEFDELRVNSDALWDAPQGLNTVVYPNINVGHQHGSYDEFIECEFYNHVGGDNIVLTDSPGANANYIIKDCRFTNTNTDLSRGTGTAIKIVSGLGTATKLYMNNNIADTTPVFVSSPLTVNLLAGNGMLVSDNDMGIAYYNRVIGNRNWN